MLVSNAGFKKSSFSKPGVHYCVEVAREGDTVVLRDSKDPDGPRLCFNLGEWDAFIEGARNREFDIA